MIKYATVFRRIIAYLLDCLVAFAVFVVSLQLIIFVPLRHIFIGSENWFMSGWNTEAYTLLTISLPIWLYFILFEISSWQATVGKRFLKLQTVDVITKSKISLRQAIIRTIIKLFPWEIAHFTNNIPTPMWYASNATFRLGFAIVPLLVILYIVLAYVTQNKQSLHDLIARTAVISNG